MSETWVYIAQLLCPQRHCLAALAQECTAEEARRLKPQLEMQFAELVAKAKLVGGASCSICGARSLHIETARSKFQTMEDAAPHLLVQEMLQRETAAYLHAMRN